MTFSLSYDDFEKLDTKIATSRTDLTLYDREFWGVARHELVAGAAEKHLSKKAGDNVQNILQPLKGATLPDVAGWADEIKRRKPKPADDSATIEFLEDGRNTGSDKWHYVDLPWGTPEYNRQKYSMFTRDDDVVQMLDEALQALGGNSKRFLQLNALRLVVHLVGDVHQPLHVGCGYLRPSAAGQVDELLGDPDLASKENLQSDHGGNQLLLPLGGKGVNLHSYWDNTLGGQIRIDDYLGDDFAHSPSGPRQLRDCFIEKLLRMTGTKVANQEGAKPHYSNVALTPALTAQQMATQSLKAAPAAYQSIAIKETDGKSFGVTWEGKQAYDNRCAPIVVERLKSASFNLATVLNDVLG